MKDASQRPEVQPTPEERLGLNAKLRIKGNLHFHRADGSIVTQPFVGEVDMSKLNQEKQP